MQIFGISSLCKKVGQGSKKLGIELIKQKKLSPLPVLDLLGSSH